MFLNPSLTVLQFEEELKMKRTNQDEVCKLSPRTEVEELIAQGFEGKVKRRHA
jgi:hypothetical protein